MAILQAAIVSTLSLLVAATALVAADASPGGNATPVAWLVGRPLQECLEQPVDIAWSAAPLRAALAGLAREHRVAVLMDRRIDPDRRVNLVLHNQPLARALAEIAARQSAASVPFGPLIYVGPPESAARLAALAARARREAARAAGPVAKRLLVERRLAWDDLTEPRALLTALGREAGLEIDGLELVPHDLWAAADLPALPWIDRLTLVAVQFDLTFTLAAEGRSLRLVAIPDRLVPSRTPPPRSAGPRGESARHPGVMADSAKRYTLRQAKGPLRELLPKLAAMLQVELRIDEEALRRDGVTLDQVVSVSVADATAEELLEKLLAPAGCTLRREGRTLVVVPKQ